MIDCREARELIPWYVNGTLSAGEARELAVHLAGCPACRTELADAIRLSIEVKTAVSRLPGAPERIREKVLPQSEVPVARLDLGSFFLGLSLGLSVKGNKIPVQGNLCLLGRRLKLFETKGGRHGRS